MEHRGDGALLDSALTLFAAKGYEGTSMRDLARTAGMSTPNVYNYTSSKEDLLWRIMAGTMRQLLSGYRAGTTHHECPVAQLSAFVCNHIRYHATHRREAIIGNGQIHFLSPQRQQAVKEFRKEYEDGLRQIIERGASSGVFDGSNPKLASFAILQMGIAVSSWFRSGGAIDVEELAATYTTYALRLLQLNEARHDLNCALGGQCMTGRLATAGQSRVRTTPPTEVTQ